MKDKIIVTHYKEIKPYITKDGSIIRELMHPIIHGKGNQSLAEAIVPPGKTTYLHLHISSEEIYCILEGKGKIRVGEDKVEVEAGDTIFIPPSSPHQITNISSSQDLRFLCCCVPPYSHDDTQLLEE